MSLVPMVFTNWWNDFERPAHLLDDVRHSPLEHYYIMPRERPHRHVHLRPWGAQLLQNQGKSTVKADKDKFEVALDVQHFKPEEITVKVVENYVVIEGKHEEKKDEHGTVSRQFVRKYLIPEKCDLDKVSSNLSSDGVLKITAPKKDQPKIENERVIAIEHTGKPSHS